MLISEKQVKRLVKIAETVVEVLEKYAASKPFYHIQEKHRAKLAAKQIQNFLHEIENQQSNELEEI